MEDLYVLDQGCMVKRYDNQFLITKGNNKITSIPNYKIEKILLFGNQQITTQATSMAFENGIDILFLTSRGKFKGKASGTNSKNIYIRFSQYEIWKDTDRKLKIAKEMVRGKIKNQELLLRKHGVKENKFKQILSNIDKVSNSGELMGYEGNASRIYFEMLHKIIPETFEFKGRNRRPPKDEVNCLLSLTYTMLRNHIIYELERAGFDTYIGFLHGIKYGRESLSLDFLEEFRQYFCDDFVIKLLNRKEFKKEDFHMKDEACLMYDKSFRKYITKINSEMESVKKDIASQVEKLKKTVMLGEEYIPVKLKW